MVRIATMIVTLLVLSILLIPLALADVTVPGPSVCRSIEVYTDKPQYTLGETVKVTVHFTHLASGCAEVQVVHFHQIRLEVFNSNNTRVQAWEWKTDTDLVQTVTWVPLNPDTYTIVTRAFWSGQRLEMNDQVIILVSSPTPFSSFSSSPFRFILYGLLIALACVLVGVWIRQVFTKHSKGKNVSPSPGKPESKEASTGPSST